MILNRNIKPAKKVFNSARVNRETIFPMRHLVFSRELPQLREIIITAKNNTVAVLGRQRKGLLQEHRTLGVGQSEADLQKYRLQACTAATLHASLVQLPTIFFGELGLPACLL